MNLQQLASGQRIRRFIRIFFSEYRLNMATFHHSHIYHRLLPRGLPRPFLCIRFIFASKQVNVIMWHTLATSPKLYIVRLVRCGVASAALFVRYYRRLSIEPTYKNLIASMTQIILCCINCSSNYIHHNR